MLILIITSTIYIKRRWNLLSAARGLPLT